MNGLRKFVRLSADRRALLLRITLLLVGVRIALWVLPWRAVIALLREWFRAGGPAKRPLLGWGFSPPFRADDLVWAVHAAGRRIPGASCLTQALALHALLVSYGFPSRVQIGVTKQRTFRAHAWVEHNGSVVLGRHEMPAYTPLLTFDASASLSGGACTTS